MDKTTKEAWMGKKNELSPEAMEKRKATNKKILKFGCLPILIILILIALIPKNDSDNENDYTVKATKLIEKLRNPKTEKELIADYDKAIALCEEMKNIKDTSNNFLIAQMELEALVTNKDNNIKNEIKKIRVKEQFSSWNGSHKNLEKYIKASMNNPKSYEHVETRYQIKDNTVMIYTKFRGTNAFNAVVTNEAVAIADLDGNLLDVKID